MFPFSGGRLGARKSLKNRRTPAAAVESLEERILLSAFTVSNLNDHGDGSLRQAILNADCTPVPTSSTSPWPARSRSPAPCPPSPARSISMAQPRRASRARPSVEVNFNNFGGLQFNCRADGSALHSLSLVDASGNGVTLDRRPSTCKFVGNYIGVNPDGATAAGNRGERN